MKCLSCDKELNDYEATRKYKDGGYIDLCSQCFRMTDLVGTFVQDRQDLIHVEDIMGVQDDTV